MTPSPSKSRKAAPVDVALQYYWNRPEKKIDRGHPRKTVGASYTLARPALVVSILSLRRPPRVTSKPDFEPPRLRRCPFLPQISIISVCHDSLVGVSNQHFNLIVLRAKIQRRKSVGPSLSLSPPFRSTQSDLSLLSVSNASSCWQPAESVYMHMHSIAFIDARLTPAFLGKPSLLQDHQSPASRTRQPLAHPVHAS